MAIGNESIKFEITAFDKTQAAFSSVQKGMGGIQNSLQAMATRLGAVSAIFTTVFGAVASSHVSKLSEELSKLSSKTGLTVEQLSRLRYAAEQNDTDINSVAVGLKFLQKNMVEAGQGSKTAQQAFAQIGVNFKDLKGLNPEGQFIVLAEAISRLTDPAQRTAAALALFGKSGTDLLPLFEEGAAGIQRMTEEADKMGATFSGVAAKNIKTMNDAIKTVQNSFEGFAQRVIGFIAPAITAAVKGLQAIFEGFAFIIEGTFKGVAYVILAALEAILQGVKKALDFATKLGLPFSTASANVEEFTAGITKLKESLNKASDGQKTLGAETNKTADALKKIGPATIHLEKMKESTKKLENVFRDAALDGVRGFGGALKELVKGTDDAGAAFERFALRVVDSISDVILQLTVLEPMEDALRGMFKGEATGGDVSSGIGSFLGDIFGGFFADGGSFGAGKPIIVGERGPEMIIPNRSGYVVPNSDMGGGGITVNQTINVTTGVQQTVRAEIQGMMPKIMAQTKAAVADARLRGGGFSAAMGA